MFERYLVAPVLAVIGIKVVGTMIEEVLGIPHATIALFIATGGILFFASFFRRG